MHHVQACISIKLSSKSWDGFAPVPVPAPLARSDSTAAKRVSLAGAGKTSSIKSSTDASSTPATFTASETQQAPQQPLHSVQVKLSGLDGLQQEVPAVAANWVQTTSSQCCEYVSVALPDVRLVVTEQRVRDWAAAAAQLQVQITVLKSSASEAAKKSAAAAGCTKGPPAPAAAATGTLLVNCAGLLAGDTSASYLWVNPQPAAAVHDAASREGSAPGPAAAATAFVSVHAPVQQAVEGQSGKFKWQVQAPTGTLQEWLESAEVQVQLVKPPPGIAEGPPPGKPQPASAAAAKPPAPKHAGAARMSAADDTAAAEHAAVLEPCSLLIPELASVLNPVVVYAYKASGLPDRPATKQQLDTLCEPVKLKAVWPPLGGAAPQPATSLSPWTTPPSSTGHDRDAISVRTATFAAPVILLGADTGQQQLLQLCRSTTLQLQVHDRTALPEPAPFTAARMQRQKQLQLQLQQQQQRPASGKGAAKGTGKQAASKAATLKAAAAQAAAAEPTVAAVDAVAESGPTVLAYDGEVYASAAVSLADLVKGRTGCCFNLPLQPVSTIRGGSCLDWKGRPGRYLEANSHIKGWVRCAAPLHTMNASMAEALAATAAAQAAAVAAAASAATAAAAQAAAAAPAGPGAAASTAGSTPSASSSGTAGKAAPPSKAAKPPAAKNRGPSTGPGTALAAAAAAAADQPGPTDPATTPSEVPAQPTPSQLGKPPQPAAHVMLPSETRFQGSITRAVFRMDYCDSEMLHVLEDAVRQHNAIVLGLAPPPPPTPEELAAIKAAEEEAAAAAAAAAAADAAAAAAAAASQRGRSARPSGSAVGGKVGPRSSLAPASKPGVAASTAGGTAAPAPTAAAIAAVTGSKAGEAAGASGLDPALASKVAARRASAAGTPAQSGTPRSILKQPQLSAAGVLVAEPSTLTSGMASSRQHPQPRASFAGDFESCGPVKSANRDAPGRPGDDDSDSDADGSFDVELSEADRRLQAALQRYDHVDLDQRLLQALSTYQLSPGQVSDEALDVLTGFHVVDGALRLFVLEGPAQGKGMQHLVTAVARWALEDQEHEQRCAAEEAAAAEGTKGSHQEQQQQQREHKWLPRSVLFNPSIRYTARLYASLGVDLWMLKLHTSLAVLGGTARTFTGHVGPERIAGMKCLLGMVQGYASRVQASSSSSSSSSQLAITSSAGGAAGPLQAAAVAALKPSAGIVLMRQMDQYQLWPTAEQLHLVDKKFGGELTKADVLGVEAEDMSSDESEDDIAQQQGPHLTAASRAGKLPSKPAQPELTGSHAAAAAAKAASAKLQQLLADSTEMGTVPAEAAGAAAAKSLKSRRSSRRSGKGTSASRRSRSRSRRRGRRSSTSSKKQRAFRPKHALDMDNSVYLHLRMEAHRRRVQRDIMADHKEALSVLSASKQPVREAWATWNPQRAAAKELQHQIEQGTLTLEDTIKAHREAASPTPPTEANRLDPEQAQALGWYPHGKPLRWPAPRDPDTYNTHPLKPSGHRVEELQEAWQEGGLAGAAAAATTSSRDPGATNGTGVVFDPLVRPRPHGLFTQDPEFWKTVHLGGDGWEDCLAQRAAAAKQEWVDKVVVKDVHFHALPGTGDKAAAQADRMANLLKGSPVKKGFKVAHAPPPPVSMYTALAWHPSPVAAAGSMASSIAPADKAKWMSTADFDALCNKQRSVVAKPGFSDSSTAALHET